MEKVFIIQLDDASVKERQEYEKSMRVPFYVVPPCPHMLEEREADFFFLACGTSRSHTGRR